MLEPTSAEGDGAHETLDVRRQLASIGELQEGWHEGDGRAFDVAKLSPLEELLLAVIEEGAPSPFLYPLIEGSVLAEWPLPEAEVSAEFDLADGFVHLVTTDVRSRTFREERLDWRQLGAAVSIARLVNELGPRAKLLPATRY